MRQVKPEGPRIYREKLYRDGSEAIVVGSASWQAWLAEEEAREFVFRADDGNWHRARREERRGSAYWYVACRVAGRVRRFYLGPAQALDCARLAAVAAMIKDAREMVAAGQNRPIVAQHYCAGAKQVAAYISASTAVGSGREYQDA